MNLASMRDELEKIAADVSSTDALAALKRLHKLEEEKPTAGQIARGALAGTVAGTAASAAREAVGGGLVRGVRNAMQAPTRAGKVLALGRSALQGLGTTAAGSAAFGSTLPIVRRYLDREAEMATIRDYLGASPHGKVRRQIKKQVGL